jgi:hypothetical protein
LTFDFNFDFNFLFVMKNIIFVFALGLASVLAVLPARVARTPALTRNFCDDELDIRDCALVRRGDSGEDDDVTMIAVVDHKRAAKDRRNQRMRAKRASESPETAKNRRARALAGDRMRLERLTVENPEAAKRWKDRQTFAVQISRAARLARESAETAKNRIAMETAKKRGRLERLAVENPDEVKRQKGRKAFVAKATRDAELANPETAGDRKAREAAKNARHRASQKALAAQDPRQAENQRARRAAQYRRYLAKKATRSVVTDPAGPSPQQAASPATQNANPQHYVPGPQAVQQTHEVEPDDEDYAHLWLFEYHDTPPTSPLW